MKKQINGFTLIELLVAMGIVAVLTGMAVFNFNQSRTRARDVQRKNDLSQLQKALELYKNDNGVLYPAEEGDLGVPQTELYASGYTKVIFNDPRQADGFNYKYFTLDKRTYYLMACLESSADQTKTVDTTICDKFNNGAQNCKCNSDKGVMYIVTQP